MKFDDEDDIIFEEEERKQVFWIVTENGYSFCSDDCLLNTNVNLRPNKSENSITERPRQIIRLNCAPFVNQTEYDFLNGVSLRALLKAYPDPDLIQIFDKSGQLKLSELREQLRRNRGKNVITNPIKIVLN